MLVGSIVAAGNVYLRWVSAPVFILHTSEWMAWESQVHHALNGIQPVRQSRRRMAVPSIAGRTVHELIRAADVNPGLAFSAFAAAVRSLWQAHQTDLIWPDGVRRSFSHGDATTRNVIYDPATEEARWIDFETMHLSAMDDVSRHADDLHALLSAAIEAASGFSMISQLCEIVAQEYPLSHVIKTLTAQFRRPSGIYELARGIVDHQARNHVCREFDRLLTRD